MSAEEDLPSILKIKIEPPSELIERVRASDVIADLDVSGDRETLLVDRIARALHAYQQKESNLPKWREARNVSIKELEEASKTFKKAVACISDNVFREDGAGVYHQDAIEGYAKLWKEETGELPAIHRLTDSERKSDYSAYFAGIKGLTEIAKGLKLLSAACAYYSESPSDRLPALGNKGPIPTEDLKSWLICFLSSLLDPYIDSAKDDYILDLLEIIDLHIQLKTVRNYLSRSK